MIVEPFQGDYGALAPLYGLSAEELRIRDLGPLKRERWLLRDGTGRIRAACVTFLRPDDRRFVSTVGASGADRAYLATHIGTKFHEPIHVSLEGGDTGYRDALRRQGFTIGLEVERFRVRFDDLRTALDRAWLPHGFEIISAADADPPRLFEADNRLRNLVPGTEGWRGDFALFRAEIVEDDAFDTGGYLVAVERSSGEYVGIVRVWRNEDLPRLGFVAVDVRLRRLPVGPALLRTALSNASEWGSSTLVTETAVTNEVVYPRLSRIAEESLGRIIQMRLESPASPG